MTKKVLDIHNLKIRFHTDQGTVHAVNGISHSISKGETIGIVGESGCGKSVSVLAVMRLLQEPPARVSGSILFNGIDLLKLSQSEIRNIRGREIAMIFQDPMTSLNPVFTVGMQLMEPLRVHLGLSETNARKRAAELLKLVGIPKPMERLHDYPHQFSGGMRQRVMIAMALTCNPSLLIADEPTTALDVTVQAQITDLVKRLRDQYDMALIWITHDLSIVAGLAHRVIVMYAGHIVEEATVDDLFSNPSHPYTAALLRSLPRMYGPLAAKLESIDGMPPDQIHLPLSCTYAPRCPYAQDICTKHMPPLHEIEPGHRAACWVDMETGSVNKQLVNNHHLEQSENID